LNTGVNCWSDQSLHGDEAWEDQIERGLRECSTFVLCVSPTFLASDWAMFEMGFALSRLNEPGFRLIPLLLHDSAVPPALRSLNILDGRKLSVQQIAEDIVGALPKSTPRRVQSALKKMVVASQRHMRQHNWEMAKSSLTDAIIACQQNDDRKTQADLSCNLGLVYERLGDLARAKSLHQQALQIDTELGYEEGIANHLYNLGRLSIDDAPMIAREQFDRARDLYARLQLEDRVADVDDWLSRLRLR